MRIQCVRPKIGAVTLVRLITIAITLLKLFAGIRFLQLHIRELLLGEKFHFLCAGWPSDFRGQTWMKTKLHLSDMWPEGNA